MISHECDSKFLNHSCLKNVPEPFPKRQILDSSKLKKFAYDNYQVDENSKKLSKRVKNTVGKGEIAPNEQFLLSPQRFQKTRTANT